jgi:hypothetical protein
MKIIKKRKAHQDKEMDRLIQLGWELTSSMVI